MGLADFDQEWEELAEEVLTGMKEWRMQHTKATLREMEAALDERLGRMRARMLRDMALASAAATWKAGQGAERPVCPKCGKPLASRGSDERRLQTHGGQEIVLERNYGVCPECRTGLFPPR